MPELATTMESAPEDGATPIETKAAEPSPGAIGCGGGLPRKASARYCCRVRLAGIFLLLFLTGTANAHELRCGVWLAELGDSEADVFGKCGQPTQNLRRRSERRRMVTIQDQWIYNRGPTEFLRILTFDAITDRLVDIRLGEYGD